MKIKYFKYIKGNIAKCLLLFSMAIFIISCEDFLDKEPLDTLSQASYWQTASQLDMYMAGKYSWLPSNDDIFWGDTPSDNMMAGSNGGGYSTYMNGEMITPTAAGSGGWSWARIREINYFFDNYQLCTDPPAKYSQALGEACFLKAFEYHKLVKQFGDVPWYSHVISPNDEAELTKKRDNRALVVDSIMALIDKSVNLVGTRSAVGWNRINKETALIYKSRVALYEATWSKYHAGTPSASTVNANAYFQKVIDAYQQLKTLSGGFTGKIYSTGNPKIDYFNLFNKEDYSNVGEVALGRRYSKTIVGASTSGINWWSTVGYWGRGYTLNLVQSFLDKNGKTIDVTDPTLFPRKGASCLTDLKATLDPRFGQSVFVPGDHTNNIDEPTRVINVVEYLWAGGYYNATASGYWPKKGNNPDASFNTNIPTVSTILFRFPEIMFNYVEAYVELNNALPNLTDNIDLIRERVGMPPLTGNLPVVDATWPNYGYNISNILAIVRNERNTEMFGEGYRPDDWKRWRAHGLFNTEGTRPRGFKYDTADYDEVTNQTLTKFLDSEGYFDPYKTLLNPIFKFRPDKDYLMPIPLEDITRTNNNLTQNPGWDNP
jgi:starch-binding outer membrane protein, SusD/RagB family